MPRRNSAFADWAEPGSKSERTGDMASREPVIISIPRGAIDHCNPVPVIEIIEGFSLLLADRNRNRLQFEVLGYGEDPRELYDIPEVKSYFRQLWEMHDGLFYWLETEEHMMGLMALLIYEPVRTGDGHVTIYTDSLQNYLIVGFMKLNYYCQQRGLSPDASTTTVTEWAKPMRTVKRESHF
jgi:hypothetical protein